MRDTIMSFGDEIEFGTGTEKMIEDIHQALLGNVPDWVLPGNAEQYVFELKNRLMPWGCKWPRYTDETQMSPEDIWDICDQHDRSVTGVWLCIDELGMPWFICDENGEHVPMRPCDCENKENGKFFDGRYNRP